MGLSICLFVRLRLKCVYKNAIFSKTKQLTSYMDFSKNPLLDP